MQCFIENLYSYFGQTSRFLAQSYLCWTLTLMSPNLCGLLEVFDDWFLGVFWVVWICNPLIELIQSCLILIPLKKMSFQREVEKQPVVLSFQQVGLHLEVFWKDLKLFDFGWLCCQTNSIGCFDKRTDWFLKILNKIC